MTLNTISYPHPVLGNGDDIGGALLIPEFDYIITDEVIQINACNLITGNVNIDALIQEKKAQWQIKIACKRTFIRESFLTFDPNWTKRLVGGDFEGTVDIEARVIAAEIIDEYSPADAHDDYENEKFNIKIGEILATGLIYTFHVDKTFDPLKAPVASLLRIEEGDHKNGPFKILLEDNYILVQLSKSDWSEYAGIKDRVSTVLHSAIVMPAITKAISEIKNNQGTMWEGRLNDIIMQRNINIEDPFEAAQEILNYPLNRMFNEVNTQLDKGVF